MSYVSKISLFSAQAANANGAAQSWPGGKGTFSAWGTFGGGTVTLQWSPDGGTTWLNADPSGFTFTTFTAGGIGGFELPTCSIRAVLSGATAPNINARVAIERS